MPLALTGSSDQGNGCYKETRWATEKGSPSIICKRIIECLPQWEDCKSDSTGMESKKRRKAQCGQQIYIHSDDAVSSSLLHTEHSIQFGHSLKWKSLPRSPALLLAKWKPSLTIVSTQWAIDPYRWLTALIKSLAECYAGCIYADCTAVSALILIG
jgi:hypothetical protein